MTDTSTEIVAALTDKEWASHLKPGSHNSGPLPHAHGMAATCLHLKPYGFSWEDVELLDDANDHEQGCGDNYDQACDCGAEDRRRRYDFLAARIMALLPPEAP